MSAAIDEPKKPQNAYLNWLGEYRAALTKEAGSGSVGVVGKLAGEKWKGMSEEQKAPWEKKAQEKKAAYEKAMEEFKAQGGTPGKRRQDKAAAKQDKQAKVDKKAKKAADKSSGRPTKPQNPYWLWLQENRAAIAKEAGSSSISAVAKLAGEKWKALSGAAKAPYEKKAGELRSAYEKAMEEWKKSSAAEGKAEEEDQSDGEGGDADSN